MRSGFRSQEESETQAGEAGTCGEALLLAAGDAAHQLVADDDVRAHVQPEDLHPPAAASQPRTSPNASKFLRGKPAGTRNRGYAMRFPVFSVRQTSKRLAYEAATATTTN